MWIAIRLPVHETSQVALKPFGEAVAKITTGGLFALTCHACVGRGDRCHAGWLASSGEFWRPSIIHPVWVWLDIPT